MKIIKKEGHKLATDVERLDAEMQESIKTLQSGGHEIVLETALDFHVFRQNIRNLNSVRMIIMANGSIVIQKALPRAIREEFYEPRILGEKTAEFIKKMSRR